MKKQIFTLSLLLIFTGAFAQKNLRLAIRGEGGVTQHFTTLEEDLQIAFRPEKAKTIFGLDANSDLVLQNSDTDKAGMTHYRYYQTYKGIQVEHTMYIAHTVQGKLTSMTGTIVTEFGGLIEKQLSLSLQKAIANALKYVHAEKYAWQDSAFEQRIKFRKGNDASYYPKAVKVWYSGEEEINPANLKLAYKVDVYSLQPLDRKYVYVDAQSGEILGTSQILKHSDAVGKATTGYSGLHTIHSDHVGSVYRLRDYTKGNGVITLHASAGHAEYTSPSSNFSYSGIDRWALDAHYGVASTWKFYKNNFNRNSIDNKGYALISWVNDSDNPDNAYWDGSEMDYGNLTSNGNGVVGIDVIGHELTHGVTENTSALNYSREPGAINESMSDIMGKSVQFYVKPSDSSWILSNDMGWEIRNFADPNADGQPDTYKGTYWVDGSSDNYGVHTNSGVGNFMFYLLVKGGSGTNDIGKKYSVSGIGLEKADQILYRTNTTYLTSMSQYYDWRLACIQAAADLYGFASNEVKQVQNAWYAVGIGEKSSSGITYCTSAGINTKYEYINKVVLGSINCTSGNNNGYKDYTNLRADLTAGNTYNITLTPAFTGSPYTEYWTVYIDYNRDGILNGLGEIVASGSSSAAKTFSFTVPSTAKTGISRLRIQMSYGSSFIDPCASFGYGEVEDYGVNIKAPVAFKPMVSLSLEKATDSKLTISPNPITGSNASVQYTVASDGKTMLRLIDMMGHSVQNEDLGYKKAGSYMYNLSNLSLVTSGNFIIVLEQNNKIIERKHIMINK